MFDKDKAIEIDLQERQSYLKGENENKKKIELFLLTLTPTINHYRGKKKKKNLSAPQHTEIIGPSMHLNLK